MRRGDRGRDFRNRHLDGRMGRVEEGRIEEARVGWWLAQGVRRRCGLFGRRLWRGRVLVVEAVWMLVKRRGWQLATGAHMTRRGSDWRFLRRKSS